MLKADGPVLVDFWAEWCGPCKMIGPALEELAGEFAGKLTVAKVNIDDNPVTPNNYAVRGIPTLILFKNGQARRDAGRRAAEEPAEGLDRGQHLSSLTTRGEGGLQPRAATSAFTRRPLAIAALPVHDADAGQGDRPPKQ